MSDEWLFNVHLRSGASKINYSSVHDHAEKFGAVCRAYSTARPTFIGKVQSAVADGIYGEVNALTFHSLDAVKAIVSIESAVRQTLPKALMGQFGFDPCSIMECPILQMPSVDAVSGLVAKFGLDDGVRIFSDSVDLNNFQGRHFYMVAAKCGNTNTIARSAGLPADKVSARLGSMLGMLATWAGCMMAGGATITLSPGALKELDGSKGGSTPQKSIFGKADLTFGDDQVRLQNANRAVSGGAQLNSFLARTLYYHALDGSVLHMQNVAANGDITWFWVGGGGKSLISKYVNNLVAINLDIGMWPDMATSIRKFYADSALIKKFVGAEPKAIIQLIPELIRSTADKKSIFLKLQQLEQVNNPGAIAERELGWSLHPDNGVKGED